MYDDVDTSVMDEHYFRQTAIRRARAYSDAVALRRAEARVRREGVFVQVSIVLMTLVAVVLQVAVISKWEV